MADVILKLINGLSIENILWLLFGVAIGAIGAIVVEQVPEKVDVLLKRSRRTESNQYLLAENDKMIILLIIELARSLKIMLTIPQIKEVEKHDDDL